MLAPQNKPLNTANTLFKPLQPPIKKILRTKYENMKLDQLVDMSSYFDPSTKMLK